MHINKEDFLSVLNKTHNVSDTNIVSPLELIFLSSRAGCGGRMEVGMGATGGGGMHSDVMMSETVPENVHGGRRQAGMTCTALANRSCGPIVTGQRLLFWPTIG